MYYDYYLYYVSYLGALYNGYPLVIRMTVVLVMVLFAVILFGIVRLLFIGYKINKVERQRKKTREHFEERLAFVLKSEKNYEIGEIQELLRYDVAKSRKWKTDVLTDLVLSVKNESAKSGNLNEMNYKYCLEALRLMGFWEKRMRTPSLSKRREALQVVGEIDNGVNSGILSKSMFHKDKDLRKTARNLYASQDSYTPFRFMEENFDVAFTQLDKLRLHATLVKKSKEVPLPNLLRWVNNSKNVQYIKFIIQEIGFFNQKDACPTLITMLDVQENRDIRSQIILTLGDLGYQECISTLIGRFYLESTSVRESIIKTMGKLKGEQALNFLTDAYCLTEDENLKMLVARSIRSQGKEGDLLLLHLQEEAVLQSREKERLLLSQIFSEKLFITA
ncbi:hypothetical protein AAW12_24300 [Sphingobacterium sp. Ag1]|nr:hypothetical protein AAW12_24300 [Sphingobacterium sp. Ag1]